MAELTNETLAEIDRLERAATKGEWYAVGNTLYMTSNVPSLRDVDWVALPGNSVTVEFIAALRNACRQMLDRIAAQAAEIERLRKHAAALEGVRCELLHKLERLRSERDELRGLLGRADVYVVAHIVSAKGALEEQQNHRDEDDEGWGDLRELIDDINEAVSVRLEIKAAITRTTP